MDVTKIINGKVDPVGQSRIVVRDAPDGTSKEKHGRGKEPQISKESIMDAVDALNAAARSLNKKVSFSYHEKAHRVIMKVQDPETNETIREIPSKEMIKLLEHIHEFIGTFVDELR